MCVRVICLLGKDCSISRARPWRPRDSHMTRIENQSTRSSSIPIFWTENKERKKGKGKERKGRRGKKGRNRFIFQWTTGLSTGLIGHALLEGEQKLGRKRTRTRKRKRGIVVVIILAAYASPSHGTISHHITSYRILLSPSLSLSFLAHHQSCEV